VRHTRGHHPDFDEWERIPDVIDHGRAIAIGNNRYTNGPTNIHILTEGDTALVVIAAPVPASRRKQGHAARTIALTAFRDDAQKIADWAKRYENKNALSPSDVNQTTSCADGSSSLPRSADGEHSANLFREGVTDTRIAALDAEVNNLLDKSQTLEQPARGAIRKMDRE
jgi:hypothetical protein